MSERESETGGVEYGGEQGGESGGDQGGQGGQPRESQEGGQSGSQQEGGQGGQSGSVGGRGPTERDGAPTTEPTKNGDSDASATESGADRAQEKQREMEESGEELPG